MKLAIIAGDGIGPEVVGEAVKVLDAVLPGLSGLAAYRTIHQRHPAARVLVVSGYGEGQMDPALRREPGTSFLQKPFTHSELLEAVQRVLSPARSRAGLP